MGAFDLIAKAAKGVKNAPFFSKADVVLDELQRGKGTGDEFLTELVKKGVKPTEIKERGLDKALKGKPKMAKAEVQRIFQEKPAPKVQEKVLTQDSPPPNEFLESKAQEVYGTNWLDLDFDERQEIIKMYGGPPTAKYAQYKTPGGENYREILLKLPSDRKPITDADIENWYKESFGTDIADDAGPDWKNNREGFIAVMRENQPTGYVSSHYADDPNLLAHIRVQDFKTPDGKKVLLVDEIQSDWHQEGRKRGYKSGDEEKQIKALADEYDKLTLHRSNLIREAEEMNNAGPAFLSKMDEIGDITPKLMQLQDQMDTLRMTAIRGVPEAPFKKNWHELAMKRVLDYAAENGYDTVAITPGAEQAKRYGLSKHVNELLYKPNDDGTYRILARTRDGDRIIHENLAPESLEDYVGKDITQKIVSGEGSQSSARRFDPSANFMVQDPMQSLSGVDLEVGGEGMKGFYDKILPDYLNNYGKQYGAQVGRLELPTEDKMVPDNAGLGMIRSGEKVLTGFHSFDITPQMREAIKTKGQPLYSKIGVPGAEATAGAATIGSQMFDENNEQGVQNPVHFTENPDAMLLELMQRN